MDPRRRRSSVMAVYSLRRGSLARPPLDYNSQKELPWDLFDRCLLPVLFAHAAAAIVSTLLNALAITQVSTFTLFMLFVSAGVGAVLFYHNLKVSVVGKGVLITDCASQIGYHIAKQLDDFGFTVYACFEDGEDSEEAQRLKDETSGRLQILQLDVLSEEDIQNVADHVKSHLPQDATGLWAVINTASWPSFGEVEWVPYSVFKKSVDVNLLSVMRISQIFLPLIRKTRGRVVNLVSILGRVTAPNLASFCACKFGVEAFSDCLRLEMRRWGVDVVVVEPGAYTTGNKWFSESILLDQARDMWKLMSEEMRQEYGEDYFEKKVRDLEKYTKGPESDLSPVLKALTDSVIRTFPLPRYTPITRAEKLQMFIADHFPRSVYDIIYT